MSLHAATTTAHGSIVEIHYGNLHDQITDLSRQSLEASILPPPDSSGFANPANIDRLRPQAVAWRRRGQQLHLSTVRLDGGLLVASSEDAAEATVQMIFDEACVDLARLQQASLLNPRSPRMRIGAPRRM